MIELEFLTGEQPVPPVISKSVHYFIENHTSTQKNEGEGGIMISAGDRVEIRVGAVTDYRPHIVNNIVSKELSKENIRESGIMFQRITLNHI